VTAARLELREHEIELAGLEAADERAALADGELEVDLGVELPELAQHARQLREREVVGRTEPQAAAHGGAGEVAHRLVLRGQDRPREPEHRVTVVGERDLPGVAVHERSSRRVLELADVLADGRLAHAELAGRLREAQRIGDRNERAQQHGIEHATSHLGGPVAPRHYGT
jgi:hypothetical protein